MLTADEGFLKACFSGIIKDASFISILIMSECIVSTHPFVDESHMHTVRDDLLLER